MYGRNTETIRTIQHTMQTGTNSAIGSFVTKERSYFFSAGLSDRLILLPLGTTRTSNLLKAPFKKKKHHINTGRISQQTCPMEHSAAGTARTDKETDSNSLFNSRWRLLSVDDGIPPPKEKQPHFKQPGHDA